MASRKHARVPMLKAQVALVEVRSALPPEKTAAAFYLSPEWRAFIAAVKAERGERCEDPEHDGATPRGGVRIFGDHVIELQDGGTPLDRRNVLLRCGACHARKTFEVRKARASAVRMG